ncbi:hypothetical protein [Qipengyuania sp. MTN3-11]|uniref:hypothetical protein n=1 Tax=Qipengyuania sp. MTN3-11 TaxID=3056557 RepID=UPI0036F1C689
MIPPTTQGVTVLPCDADLLNLLDVPKSADNLLIVAAHRTNQVAELVEAASRLIDAYDGRLTVAEQIVTGRNDDALRKQAKDALDDLRTLTASCRGESK